MHKSILHTLYQSYTQTTGVSYAILLKLMADLKIYGFVLNLYHLYVANKMIAAQSTLAAG